MTSTPELARRPFVAGLFLVLLLAISLRIVFPTADPPWRAPVGITWHDEGPWVHNARNRALWGTWSTDQWNPMFLAPVFSALEYASFASLGVGLWQARVVSIVMGILAILLVALGVSACAGRRAGLLAGLLLAANHEWVQWNRVALLETTMVAFIAISWGAYALAARRPAWGAVAGIAAVLAFFSKASAAFYIAALGLEVVLALGLGLRRAEATPPAEPDSLRPPPQATGGTASAVWTLAGMGLAGAAFLVLFVLPHWTEFRFYNWQMSVTRKPSYGIRAFVDRGSWVPVVNDFFTRMLPVTALGLTTCLGLLVGWTRSRPAERLLAIAVALGLAELVAHDAGNERRLLMFVPMLIALAAIALGGGRSVLPAEMAQVSRRRALIAAPAVLYAAYVVCGALARTVTTGVGAAVWLATAAAVLATVLLYASWPRPVAWLARHSWPARESLVLVALLVAADLYWFSDWAVHRTYKNVTASRLVGEWLPPGTPVQGKLANGLALDNRIKPIFIGRGFGNYDDRLRRDDVRYVLTYVDPWVGYEGRVITDVLDGCPGWRILKTFDVAETATGHDRAAVVLKPPHCNPDRSPRAKD